MMKASVPPFDQTLERFGLQYSYTMRSILYWIGLTLLHPSCASAVPYPRHAHRDIPHKAHRGGAVPANVKKMNSPAAKVCRMHMHHEVYVSFLLWFSSTSWTQQCSIWVFFNTLVSQTTAQAKARGRLEQHQAARTLWHWADHRLGHILQGTEYLCICIHTY